MIIHRVITFIFLLFFAGFPAGVFGADSRVNVLSGMNSGDNETCRLIKDNISRGVDARSVTKTNIQLGRNACYVIKCAIDGGGSLRLVIAGAMEAGATADVVTKCCVDAGAEPGMIAQILQSEGEGLGYSPPGDEMIPMAPAPRGISAGRFISPSSF